MTGPPLRCAGCSSSTPATGSTARIVPAPAFHPIASRRSPTAYGELLDLLAPEGVVTSAAAGADLLMVEAAEKRQVPVHVVLPFPRARFRAVSVEDQGPRWVSAFEHAVEGAPSWLVELDLEPGVEGLQAGNQALLDHASALARSGGVLVVAVRPPGGEDPPSVTDDFVRRAVDAGRFVIEVNHAGLKLAMS